MFPLTQIYCLYTDFNTTINLYDHPFFTSFLRQLNQVCQSSSLSSKMMGNKVGDFHKQITLLNFDKFQFNEINNALNRFSKNVFTQ